MNFKSFWNTISTIGILEDIPESDRIKISLINQLSLVALSTSVAFLIVHTISSSPAVYDDIATIIFSLSIFYLQKKGFHIIARHITCWLFPLAVFGMTIFGGRDFGQASVFILCAILTFIQYEGQMKIKTASLIYVGLLGFCSSLYLVHFGSTALINPNPYDKTITFTGILVIGILIVYFYQKDIKEHVLQRKKLIDKLERKNEELVRVNAELDQFTFSASHDLKSPLRNVISFSDLLEMKIKRGKYEDANELLGYIKNGAKQMKYLVEDILELSKLDSEEHTEVSSIDLNHIVAKVKQTLSQEINEKNAIISHDELPCIQTNETKMFVLFQNLIQNGIKYNTSTVPEIGIWVTESSTMLELHFKDNGIGIDPEYHDKVFDFFKRLHNSKEYEGTGIGLGMCKKIVKKMNGQIYIKSTVGNGSVFTVQLPKILTCQHVKQVEAAIQYN